MIRYHFNILIQGIKIKVNVNANNPMSAYSKVKRLYPIAQNTAWCEQEGVREAIEKAFPSIKVYYIEEEPGCDVYDTNDSSGKYFPERFYLDSYDQQEYFETIEEAADYVAKIVGHKVEASVDAIDEALDDNVDKQNNKDVFYCFHEFTVIDS